MLSVAARAHTSPLRYFQLSPAGVLGDHSGSHRPCSFRGTPRCQGSRVLANTLDRFLDARHASRGGDPFAAGRAWFGVITNGSRSRFRGRLYLRSTPGPKRCSESQRADLRGRVFTRQQKHISAARPPSPAVLVKRTLLRRAPAAPSGGVIPRTESREGTPRQRGCAREWRP